MPQNEDKNEKFVITEIGKMKYVIERDAKREVRSWAWKWLTIVGVILTFFGWQTYTGMRNFQKEMMEKVTKEIKYETEIALEKTKKDIAERIKQSYDETNIDVIVDDLIKEDAKALIASQLREEINPIIKKIEKDQKRFSEIVTLHELAINAESGDRSAFEELEQIAFSPQHPDSLFAYRICYKVYKKYNTGLYTETWFPDTLPDAQVIEFLTSDAFTDRERAVFTIGNRRLYNQVTTFISMLKTEPNIEVVAALTWVLNEMLGVKLEVLEEDAVDKFSRIWNEKKNELLKKGRK